MTRRALIFVAVFLAAPAAQADEAAVQRTWLERVAISAADKSCNLFTEGERLALQSGLYQAEGELLRANKTPAEMNRLAAEVSAHARSLGCAHPSVVQVAATIRSSYRQFAKTNYLEYPAARSTWGASRAETDKWAVSQTDKLTGLVFGLRRTAEIKEGIALSVTIPAQGMEPSSIQLVLRDPAKMPEPWLGSIAGATKKLVAAPRSIANVEWAGKIFKGKDADSNPVWIFYFSPSAITRLEALDPREAIQIDIVPSQRAKDQTVRHIQFEVGDIRAAHAFSMIPKPEPTAIATTSADPAPAAH